MGSFLQVAKTDVAITDAAIGRQSWSKLQISTRHNSSKFAGLGCRCNTTKGAEATYPIPYSNCAMKELEDEFKKVFTDCQQELTCQALANLCVLSLYEGKIECVSFFHPGLSIGH